MTDQEYQDKMARVVKSANLKINRFAKRHNCTVKCLANNQRDCDNLYGTCFEDMLTPYDVLGGPGTEEKPNTRGIDVGELGMGVIAYGVCREALWFLFDKCGEESFAIWLINYAYGYILLYVNIQGGAQSPPQDPYIYKFEFVSNFGKFTNLPK